MQMATARETQLQLQMQPGGKASQGLERVEGTVVALGAVAEAGGEPEFLAAVRLWGPHFVNRCLMLVGRSNVHQGPSETGLYLALCFLCREQFVRRLSSHGMLTCSDPG